MVIPGFKGISLGEFARRLYRSLSETAVSDSAAQLAFYLVFSLFPFLFFLVTLTAFLPVGDALNELVARVRPLVPGQAFDLITTQLDALIHQPRPRLLTLGLVTAIYSASRGVDSMRTSLNRAYKVSEGRGFLHAQLVSIGLTVVGTLLVVGAIAAMLLGGKGGEWLFSRLHAGSEFTTVWSWMRWPTTALVIMFTSAVGYFVLPDVKQRFKFITPGSVLGTLVWLLGSFGLSYYTEHFSRTNVTYGSIGSVILLMTWFYVSGLIFIVGGVINAVIEHASTDGKAEGAKVEGAPAASREQELIAQTAGAAKHRAMATWLRHVLHSRRDQTPS